MYQFSGRVLAKTIIVATQNAKSTIMHKYPLKDVMTIQEIQGSTVADAAVYIGDQADFSELKKKQWLYTVITRHTRSLMWFGDTALIQQFFNMANYIPVNLDKSLVNIQNMAIYEPPKPAPQPQSGDSAIIASEKPNYDVLPLAEDALSKVLIKKNDTTETTITDLIYPKIESGKLRINTAALLPTFINTNGQLLGNKRFCKAYSVRDAPLAVQTLVGRYQKRTRNVGSATLYKEMKKGFLQACNMKDSRELSNYLRPTYEELVYHAKEYIITAEQKNMPDREIEKIFTELFECGKREQVDFHMKQQIKYQEKCFWDAAKKAGQGISAWKKNSNIVHAAFSRHMQQRFIKLFNGKATRVLFACGYSDRHISEMVRSAYQQCGFKPKSTLNDFSEYDSSVGDASIDFDCWLIRMCGAPSHIVDDFKKRRSCWDVSLRTNGAEPASASGVCYDKQTSGNMYTLVLNTMNNIAIVYAILEMDDIVLNLFKGDDSGINARDIRIRTEMQQLFMQGGYKFKIATTECPEFATFFYGKYGFFPDVYRKCARLLSRVIPNEAEFEQLMRNVENDMSVILCDEAIEYYSAMSVMHYFNHGFNITRGDIYNCYNFLRHARTQLNWKQKYDTESCITYFKEGGM